MKQYVVKITGIKFWADVSRMTERQLEKHATAIRRGDIKWTGKVRE